MTTSITDQEKLQIAKNGLLRVLEDKASALLLVGNSGSFAIAQLSCAKESCRAAGITEDDIQDVINAVSERRRV